MVVGMGTRIFTGPQFPSLLLVQKNGPAGRALKRFLTPYYGEVVLAQSPDAARALIEASGADSLHLVCGEDFGPQSPRGHQLIADLRRQYPQIERAILATGAESLPDRLGAIDAIFFKPSPPSELLHLLGVRARSANQPNPSAQHSSLENTMKDQTTKAHSVRTLKDRLAQSPKQESAPGQLRPAQGFAVA
jgi:DNA-binding response OmpR family regulator